MTVKYDLLRAVMGVLLDNRPDDKLTDADFDFLQQVSNYGDYLNKVAVSEFHQSEMAFVVKQEPVGDAQALSNTIKGDSADRLDTKAPEMELDRGPEPQTVADTLSTEAPEPKLPDVNDAPELLSTKKQ